MELGSIQKAWIKSLRENPERQTTGKLGFVNFDGQHKRCCLGELHCIYREQNGKEPVIDENLDLLDVPVGINEPGQYSSKFDQSLEATFEDLGLRDSLGLMQESFFIDNGDYVQPFNNLADLNDGGFTWEQIADMVENDPENFFTKSL